MPRRTRRRPACLMGLGSSLPLATCITQVPAFPGLLSLPFWDMKLTLGCEHPWALNGGVKRGLSVIDDEWMLYLIFLLILSITPFYSENPLPPSHLPYLSGATRSVRENGSMLRGAPRGPGVHPRQLVGVGLASRGPFLVAPPLQ